MRILHVSDLHFGMRWVDEKDEDDHPVRRERSMHAFIADGKPDPRRLPDVLCRDLRSRNVDAVVVSGDLGWAGKPGDYLSAAECLELLRAGLNSPILIVPGNHDYDRDIGNGKASGDPQGAFVDFLRRYYGDSFGRHFPFYDLDLASPTRRQRLVCVEWNGRDLLVVGMNSAGSMGPKSTPVHIDPDVLLLLETHIAQLGVPRTAFRVLALHHHILPS